MYLALYSGGAIYSVDFCNVAIDASIFRANVCPYVGGALSGTFVRMVISDTEFTKNRAIESGGVLSGELGFYAFTNITAYGNFATNGAFADMIAGSTLIFNQSVFATHMVCGICKPGMNNVETYTITHVLLKSIS